MRKACPGVTGPSQGVTARLGGKHAVPALGGQFQHCISEIVAKFHGVETYQPASRYWAFQLCETALFVVLALAIAGLSYWWLRRRLT